MKLRSIAVVLLAALSAAQTLAAPKRAVSLRVLQSTIKSGDSRQAMELCGITKVSGFLLDRKTRDIIIFGDVDPTRPALQFDDFVVAMRSAWYVYARKSGNTRYYSPPGCSIDPNPDTLRRLQQLSARMSTLASLEDKEKALAEWKEIGHEAQHVRVMGVPFDSRFAKVMVDADFYMKRLVNGSVTLGIDGFKSLTDLNIESTRRDIAEGKSADTGQTLNRFWFCPGDTTFTGDDGVIALRSCPVRLLTEEEFLTLGGVQGYGRPNPMARTFADAFTARYSDIAAQRPIYKELEGLFRLSAIAKLIKSEGSGSGFDPSYLLSDYHVKTVAVNRAVTGISDIREIRDDAATSDGRTSFFWHMSCGGVSMDIRPRRVPSTHVRTQAAPKPASRPSVNAITPSMKPILPKDTSAAVPPTHHAVAAHQATASRTPKAVASQPSRQPTIRKAVLSARKSANSLYWDVPNTD